MLGRGELLLMCHATMLKKLSDRWAACIKKYPRQFADATTRPDDSYPLAALLFVGGQSAAEALELKLILARLALQRTELLYQLRLYFGT